MPAQIGQGGTAPEVTESAILSRLEQYVGGSVKDDEPPEDDEAPAAQEEPVEGPIEEAAEEAAEEGAPEEKAAEDEVKAEVEIDPDAPLLDVTVKLEGGGEETRKISLNEAKLGYMRREDYQRKTAEVARAREAVATEVDTKVKEVATHYSQNLDVVQKAMLKFLQAEFSDVDMNRLAEENPAEAVRIQHRAGQANLILQAVMEETQKLQEKARADSDKAFQEATRKCVETLTAEVPGWGKDLANAVSETGKAEYGFSQDELNTLSDPRMIKVLIDAHKYRQLQAAKPAIKNKVVAAPKMLKPGAKDESAGKPGPNVQKQREMFRKTGNIRDAAKYLENFL